LRTAVVLLVIPISLAGAACLTHPTPVVGLGVWGGTHIRMDVIARGAQLEYDCATGGIEERLRPDADGRFTAVGSHTPGHGGPIREGEVFPTFRARYDGHVRGDRMTLTVTLTDTDVVIGSFELQRASSGHVFKCL
jgi:hypothetical protein